MDFGNGFTDSKLSMGYSGSDIMLFLEDNYRRNDFINSNNLMYL